MFFKKAIHKKNAKRKNVKIQIPKTAGAEAYGAPSRIPRPRMRVSKMKRVGERKQD
jgi:hypothetical protein